MGRIGIGGVYNCKPFWFPNWHCEEWVSAIRNWGWNSHRCTEEAKKKDCKAMHLMHQCIGEMSCWWRQIEEGETSNVEKTIWATANRKSSQDFRLFILPGFWASSISWRGVVNISLISDCRESPRFDYMVVDMEQFKGFGKY